MVFLRTASSSFWACPSSLTDALPTCLAEVLDDMFPDFLYQQVWPELMHFQPAWVEMVLRQTWFLNDQSTLC